VLNSNIGVAGGWAKGVREALKQTLESVGGIVSVLGGGVEDPQ
jgi:hypothetical protein